MSYQTHINEEEEPAPAPDAVVLFDFVSTSPFELSVTGMVFSSTTEKNLC